MARSSTSYPKGTSGNPKGPPPKARRLTVQLATELSRRAERDGKLVNGKQILASLVASAVLNGYVEFPDGTRLELGVDDWKDFVKFVYQHIDGGPPTQTEHSGLDGGPLVLQVVYENKRQDPDDPTA